MAMNPEQAKQALDAGLLSPETYSRVLGSSNQAKAVPGLVPAGAGIPALQAIGRGVSNAANAVGRALTSDAELEVQDALAAQAPAPVDPNAPQVIDEAQFETLQTSAPAPQVSAPVVTQPNVSAFDKASNAILNAAALGDQKAAEIEAYTKSFEQKKAEEVKKSQDEFDFRQQEVEKKMLDLDSKLDEIAKQQIDPNRIFSNMSFGQKLGTFVLTSLGGKGGIQKLDDMIKRDISAQENLKSGAMDIMKQKSSLYKDLMETYKDKISVRNSLGAAMMQAAQQKVEGLAAITKNAQVKASLIEKAAELDIKKQEYRDQFAKRQQLLAAEQQLEIADPITAKITRLPPAAQKPLLEAKEVYDATKAAFSTIDSIFKEAKGIGAIEGNIPFSDAKARVQANNANIESAIRATMKGQGTIQESEIERLVKPLLPLPSDTSSVIDIKRQKLKQLLETKNAGQIGRLSNMGLLPSGSLKSAEDKIKPRQ